MQDDADGAEDVPCREELKFEFTHASADADIKWFASAQGVTGILACVCRTILGPLATTTEDLG